MMIQTGIGWRHPHYAPVLQDKPSVGFLQVHSENFFGTGGAAFATLHAAREHYPISLHGVGLSLGSACGLDEAHLDQLAQLVQRIDPVRVSDHACFARGLVNEHHVHAADLLPIPFTHESLDVLCANVQRVQERLKRPFIVEHLSAYIQFTHNDFSETDFLNALTQRTGCSLLLDVNNLYVNALNDQLTGRIDDPLLQAQAWIQQIRAGSVAEMHLAGHCVMEDIVIDDHGSRVSEPVWALYALARARFAEAPALIEWDTDVPALDVLLSEAAHADALLGEVAA
jgi:uncharacterized protein